MKLSHFLRLAAGCFAMRCFAMGFGFLFFSHSLSGLLIGFYCKLYRRVEAGYRQGDLVLTNSAAFFS